MNAPTALNEVGSFVREARQKRGIGLRAFAREVGVYPSNLCNIEAGRLMPGVEVANRLLQPFGFEVRQTVEIVRN